MDEKQMHELTSEMMQFLQGEKVIFLSTLDHEEGVPSTTCISWLLAVSPNKIKFAIDPRSRVIRNIAANPRLTVAFIGLGGCFSVSGSGSSDLKQLDGVTINMTEVSVDVVGVRDIMFYGSKITADPEFEKTYNIELANKFDTAVYGALAR